MKPISPRKVYALSGAIALVSLVLDQLSKEWMIVRLGAHGFEEVLPFFNLTMVWNYGVSFGLMAQDSTITRWALILVAGAISTCMVVWLKRDPRRGMAWAVGMILGGAVGNVIDRIRYGAVMDFFDFHVADMHWPAFNIADSCIFLGVALLCIDALKDGRKCNETNS